MSLRKTIVSGAAALAIMGTAASAVNLATDGTGDYLIAPVYYAAGNWKTDIKVVNTNTTRAVVAKVVVRGGKNSKELVDFAIYLSPGDVWDAKLYQDTDGNVYIESHDDSLMLGQKPEIVTIKDENASGDCVEQNITLIAPVIRGDVDGFKKNLTKVANQKDDEARRGYVEILGLAQYNPQDIINEINSSVFTWNEGCEFNKTLLYTGARIAGNSNDLNDTNANDVSGADLTGEQTISATAATDQGKRFMKLQMLAVEDLAVEPKTDGVLGPDTDATSGVYSDVSASAYHAMLNKRHVYVLYEGNNDATEISPMQVLFTYPYKDVSRYDISTADTMFRDKMEKAIACSHNPCHTGISTDLCGDGGSGSGGFTGTNPDEEISGDVPPPPEGCPVIRITDEVGVIFHHDPSVGKNDPYITQYAFKTGGYIDIDLSNVPVSADVNKTTLPIIPTTIMAKDVDGLYLNNHLYNPYNR